jgi:hypothetical protein
MFMLFWQSIFLNKKIFVVEFECWGIFPVLISWVGDPKLRVHLFPKPKRV